MALRDLLLKISGDSDDARRAIADVAKEGADFARQEYEALLDANTEQAETAIQRAKRELSEYGRISVDAAAGVEIAKGEAQIDRLKTRLDNLAKQEPSPKVDAQTTRALLALERVQARVDKLTLQRAEIDIRVNESAITQSLGEAAAAARSAIAAAVREVADGGRLSATTQLDVDTAIATAEVDRLQARIAELGAQAPSVEVDAEINRALADLERVQTRLDKLRTERVEIQIKADESALADLDKVNLFARDGTASLRQLSGAAAQAQAAIAAAVREVAQSGRLSTSTQLDVDTTLATAEVERLQAHIAELGAQTPTVEVNAEIKRALADLDRVQARVDRLKTERAEINVDVDTGSTSAIDLLRNAVGGLISAIGSGGGGGGLAGVTARASFGFISLGAAAGPLAAIIALLTGVIAVALVGALAALVASAAAAAAAIGALGVAIAGALGPVVGVAIAAVVRFAKVIEALRAQSAATQQAQQQAAAGSAAVTAAAAQQETAARALTAANERLGDATTQAYREMADAAEAARDAVDGVAQAESRRDQADIDTRKAIEDLARLRGELGSTGNAFDAVFQKFTDVNVDLSGLRAALGAAAAGSGQSLSTTDELALEQAVQRVRQARLDEKRAIDAVSDAETNRIRTQQRANEFAREGIRASDGYQAALRGVADAQRQVNAAAQAQTLTAAQTKAQVLTDELSDSERKLLAVLQQVGTAFRTALGPATDAVLGGLATALGSIATLATKLAPAFTIIGAAIGSALAIFAGELVKPEWIAALNTLALAGAQLIGIFASDIALPFMEILRDIAVAALPFLISGMQAFGQLLKGLAAESSVGALTPIFEVLVENLDVWLQLIGAIGAVMLAFFKSAAGPGKGLVDSLIKGALALANWLNTKEGMAAVKKFFDDTLPLAVSFVGAVLALVPAIVDFAIAAAPTLAKVFDAITLILSVIGDFGLSFGAVAVAAIAILKALGVNVGKLKDKVGDVADAFKTAFDFVKRQVGLAIDFIERQFNAFVDRAKKIGGKIGDGIVSGIRSALNALSNVGKGIGNFIIGAINKVFGLLNKIKIKIPKVLGVGGGSIGFDISPIQKLGDGGITTSPTFAEIGDKGREAVLPLTRSVFAELAAAITREMRLAAPNFAAPRLAFAGAGAAAPAGGGGITIERQEINVKAPAGALPDARYTAVQIANAMRRRGG